MRLVVQLVRALVGRPSPTPRPRPRIESERLERIYRDTHRHVEELRRAA